MTILNKTSLAWVGVALVALSVNTLRAEEKGIDHPWTVSLGLGKLDTEGDSTINDARLGTLSLDYSLSQWFSIEGSLTWVPRLTGNYYTDYSSGTPVAVNTLKSEVGVSDTWAMGAAIDVLYHVSPWTRVDPYLSLGYGVLKYGKDLGENEGLDTTPRAGAGLLYHLSDSLALRADYRYFLTGSLQHSDSNSKFEIGVAWTFGANTPMVIPPSGVMPVVTPAGDDAAKPMVAPVVSDTEHKDREKYTLHIEFAEGSSKLLAQYYEHLDVIGEILKNAPDATAKIEGHSDQLTTSSERQAKNLTLKRAEAIRDYLAGGKWKLAKKRMETVGYGFSKPMEKPDLVNGNLANRRIEIYIIRPAASARQGTINPSRK